MSARKYKNYIVGALVLLLATSLHSSWLTGWNYRKLITISGSSGAGAGYQVLLKVGESSGASGAHFHIEGHSANFPADIRFTDDDETTLLSHWLEKIEGSAPNRVAYFWVKVNDNLDSSRNIFIYYGNSSASSASNGDATFLLFDDFNSGFNDAKWARTDPADVYVEGGIMKIRQNVTDKTTWLRSKINTPWKIAVESVKQVHYANQYYVAGMCIANLTYETCLAGINYDYYFYAPDANCYYYNRDSFQPLPCLTGVKLSPFWQDTWFRESLCYTGNNGAIKYIRNRGLGDEIITHTGIVYTDSTRLHFWPYGWWTGHYQYIDWIAVRRYNSPEPSFSSAGSEQFTLLPPVVTNASGASDITTTSARLNGILIDNGNENPTVHIFWGTSDGGTNQSAWENDINLGTLPEGPFYYDITGLSPNTTYYYRCYAQNSAGSDWADETASFITWASIVVDWNNGNVQTITLQGNAHFTFTNGKPGGIYKLLVKGDDISQRTIKFDPAIVIWVWPYNTPPDFTIAPNRLKIFDFICYPQGSSIYYLGVMTWEYELPH